MRYRRTAVAIPAGLLVALCVSSLAEDVAAPPPPSELTPAQMQEDLAARALPRLMPADGKIFVLVDRVTFSAALVTAAMIKAEGGDRAVLVGETMGDAAHFWAEGDSMTLPNSAIRLRYSDGYHVWGRGCPDLDKCYWAVVALHTRAVSLEPTIRAEPSFADYAAGRDPVLSAALSRAP